MSFPACLLCGAAAARTVFTLSGAELRQLFRASGRALSEPAFGPITPPFVIRLFECTSCGFQYFDPTLAGSGEFYAELEQAPYYPATRPEFEFALRFCREQGLQRLLDVGAGDGAFLDLARGAGRLTYGVELNLQAAAAAKARGHSMVNKLVGEFTADDLGGPVDFISFFQVVEHVPDPRRLIRTSAELVRPGGYLMVSVPSRAGLFRLLPYDPANLPPHHLSRWRRQDLETLAAVCGLRVAAMGHDVLYGIDIEKFWLQHNRLAAAIDRPAWPGGSWLPKLVSFLYRKLGCRYYFPRRGLSIYAVMQRV